MIKRLILFLLLSVYSVDSFSTHAAGMDISYKFIGTTDSPAGITGTGREVTVTVITDRNGSETSWDITDAAGNIYSQGGPYTNSCNVNNRTHVVTVCLPTNTQLNFNWYDSNGNGWASWNCGGIQGTYSVTQGTATLTSGTPTNGSGGSSTFSVNNFGTPVCTWTTLSSTETLDYEITLAFYYDCENSSGIGNLPNSFNIFWEEWATNNGGGYNTTNLAMISGPTNVTPVCNTISNPCTYSLAYAYQKYVYKGVITFPNRDSWKIWSEPESFRNTTTHGPGGGWGDELCVIANIDNTTYISSSPVFSSDPISFLCTGGDCFYNGAIDPDMDNLTYTLTPPKVNEGLNQNMIYQNVPGQNGTYLQPFPNSTTTCDVTTGDLCINTNITGTSVAAIRVTESRNGTSIGFVTRDIQIWAKPCTGITTTSSVSSGPNILFNTIDNIFSFCVDGSSSQLTFDVDVTSTVPIELTHSTLPTGASFINNPVAPFSSNTISGTFSWIPTIADVAGSPYVINVITSDDECPIPNSTSESFIIKLTNVDASATFTEPTCGGMSDGSITVTATGATPPYQYSIDGGTSWQPSNIFSSLSAGTYTIDVKDDYYDCTDIITVVVTEPTQLTNTYSFIEPSCTDSSDGEITITTTLATPPYEYSINGGTSWQSSNIFSSLSDGTYTIDVKDAYNCKDVVTVTLTDPLELTVSSVFSDVNCFGGSDGSIDLTISGGTPNYDVSWTSVNGYTSTGSNISNLSLDVYTAAVTDANGCGPIVEIISITEPTEITIFGTPNDNSCFQSNDGSIDISAAGGVPPFTYNWTGPSLFSSNQEDISNLTPGTYTVTVSDLSTPPCISINSYVVNEPPDIIVTHVPHNVSCFDGNDGFIELTISGGSGNYNTTWIGSNGYSNISEDIFTLIADDYSYVITDADNCSPSVNSSPITITEPSAIHLSSVVTDETCYGDSDGSVTLNISGGTPSYTFSWTGPNGFSSTNLDISSLGAGTYNLQITDLNNCPFYHSSTISIGSIIQVDTFINNISCNGYSDGNIFLLAPSSINPTFNWTGPSSFISTSNQILNLEAGNYSAIVNDQTNCATLINLNISEPQSLSLLSILTDESCDGYQDGQIEVFVSGGTSNYSYVWSNGNTDSINSNLLNGEYILNVVDNNNCILTDTFTIDLFLFDTTRNITNVSCYGGSDGSADLEIVGGNPPFTYNWSPPGSTQDLIAVSSGIYTVNITDFTNCTIVRDVIVTEPQQLSAVTNITNILCYGDSTGSVLTTIYGGTLPYLLDWGSSDTSQMWAGPHSFTVTDTNGCKFTDSINIQQNDSMQITATITDAQCYGDSNGSVDLQIAQGTGTPPYDYLWSGSNLFSDTTEDIYNLESGDYSVIVTDANMCSQFLNLFVDQPQQISQTTTVNTSNYSGYNVRCKGENSAWVDISISGGYPPFTYLWNNGDVTDSIFNLYEGTYSLQITDSLGCTEGLSVNLDEPPTYVTVDVIATSDYNGYNISCFGVNDGSVFAEASNGVGPDYTYLWNNNDKSDSITGIFSGYYEVFVYDKNLCLAIDSVTLSEPSELFFDLLSYSDTCEKSVGKAEFIASGGVPNYSAVWSDSSTTNIVNHFSEGTYSVEVSDSNSCKKSASFSIDNLESPISDFEAYPYHKRLLDQKNDPFYFVDLTNTFWSSVEYWTWDFGDGFLDYDSLVSHSYDSAGIYTVNLEITTFANCTDTISKDILVDEYAFYIPNTFIPSSSEDENRIFKGYGTGVEEYELKIFSRWGELIFTSNNLDVGWDGTNLRSDYNNFNEEDLCPVGVYTYTVFIENIYGEVFEYQGQLKLLR